MLEGLEKNLVDFTKDTYESFKKQENQIIGIAGFYATVKLREQKVRSAQVTDYYVEDGNNVSDNIVLDPLILTIEGEVSKTHIKDNVNNNIFIDIQDKTAQIVNTLYTVQRSVQNVQRLRDIATSGEFDYKTITEALEQGETLYNLFTGNRKDMILNFDEFMERIYNAKIPIMIETFTKNYDNMVMTTYSTTKTNETEDAIQYTATFRQVRPASTILSRVQNTQKRNPSGSMKNQAKSKTDKGVTNGRKVPTSLINTVIGIF